MSLFSKKKNKEDLRRAMMPPKPELPEFPDIPEDDESDDFSTYEATISDIKNEVDRDESFDVPKRDSKSRHVMMDKKESKIEEFPSRQFDDDKPMFVQIDKYKEAMKHMEALAKKIGDAEGILDKLDQIRSQEEQKIDEWKKDLASIKDKLLSIDRELFENG